MTGPVCRLEMVRLVCGRMVDLTTSSRSILLYLPHAHLNDKIQHLDPRILPPLADSQMSAILLEIL